MGSFQSYKDPYKNPIHCGFGYVLNKISLTYSFTRTLTVVKDGLRNNANHGTQVTYFLLTSLNLLQLCPPSIRSIEMT